MRIYQKIYDKAHFMTKDELNFINKHNLLNADSKLRY